MGVGGVSRFVWVRVWVGVYQNVYTAQTPPPPSLPPPTHLAHRNAPSLPPSLPPTHLANRNAPDLPRAPHDRLGAAGEDQALDVHDAQLGHRVRHLPFMEGWRDG